MTTPAPPPGPDPTPAFASRRQLALYRVVRALLAAFSRTYWRLTVGGGHHVPATGPFVLAPVHRSNVDTPVVAALTRRRLRFIGKQEMWKYGWSAWLFTALGGFPVRRGTADREALRKVAAVLDAGQPVVMFPEGTRRAGAVVEDLFDGPAFVAARTGVPIVPVGIGGTHQAMPRGARTLRPAHVHVEVGPPLVPPPLEGGRVPRRVVRELTAELTVELQRLYDVAQERAGRPNR